MKCFRVGAAALLFVFALHTTLDAGGQTKRTPREALQAFNDLIGKWCATVTPASNKNKFWVEEQNWGWQFKDKDAWLTVTFDKSKNYTSGELRYQPDQGVYQLTLLTTAKEKRVYTGTLKDKVLTLESIDEKQRETRRLVFKLLHANRYLYAEEVKKADRETFAKLYSVGVTKADGSFASGDGKPECIVSGGLGTTPVTYMGVTYYVCCSGCRSEFNADPAKYVKEFKARQAKKAK